MFGFGNKNAAIETFADTLVADLVRRFPPSKQAELGGNKVKPGRQLGNAVNDLERSVAAFQQTHRLGIYGKAKLLNKIKWQLKDRDYAADFIDVTTTTLARFLNKRR